MRATARAALVSTATVAALITACDTSATQSGGDPGNKRLHAIAADPIFTQLPPESNARGIAVRTPAKYRQPGVGGGGGWDGPSVVLSFTNAEPPATVFAFFAKRAKDTGWSSNGNRNSLGYPESWIKPLTSRDIESLGLTDQSLNSPTPQTPATYVLSAGG